MKKYAIPVIVAGMLSHPAAQTLKTRISVLNDHTAVYTASGSLVKSIFYDFSFNNHSLDMAVKDGKAYIANDIKFSEITPAVKMLIEGLKPVRIPRKSASFQQLEREYEQMLRELELEKSSTGTRN